MVAVEVGPVDELSDEICRFVALILGVEYRRGIVYRKNLCLYVVHEDGDYLYTIGPELTTAEVLFACKELGIQGCPQLSGQGETYRYYRMEATS